MEWKYWHKTKGKMSQTLDFPIKSPSHLWNTPLNEISLIMSKCLPLLCGWKTDLIKFPGTFAQLLPRSLRVTSSKSLIRHGSASAAVKERLEKELDGIKNAGTWKTERVITSRQDVSIDVQGSKGKILNFCANNYLGLSVSITYCCLLWYTL